MNLLRKFLVLLISCVFAVKITPPFYLTPYIKEETLKRLARSRNLSEVNATQFLRVPSHAGYITVNKEYNSHMSYRYIPVQRKPVEYTPIIICLQGVGRCEEWGSKYSLLFIDIAVCIGKDKGFVRDLNQCAEQLYKVVKKFLSEFPEARIAPLYVAGETYAARLIAAFAHTVFNTKEATYGKHKIYLMGLILDNPTINLGDFASMLYQRGLIDKQGLIALKSLQDANHKAIGDGTIKEAQTLRNKLVNILQQYNILQDKTNLHEVLIADLLTDSVPIISQLLEKCRILLYCGQLDLSAMCAPSAAALTWSHREQFLQAPRVPWEYNGTVAGYVKSGGGLTEVQVCGAGHLQADDKLVSNFIGGRDFPLPANYSVDSSDTPDHTEPTNDQYSQFMSFSNVVKIVGAIAFITLAMNKIYKKYFNNCQIYSRFQTQRNNNDTETVV